MWRNLLKSRGKREGRKFTNVLGVKGAKLKDERERERKDKKSKGDLYALNDKNYQSKTVKARTATREEKIKAEKSGSH